VKVKFEYKDIIICYIYLQDKNWNKWTCEV